MTQIVIEQHANLTWEEAVTLGQEYRVSKDTSQWQLGDLALKVEAAYGTDAIGRLAIDININKKSLQQYRRVSAAFPPAKRLPILSHRHHLILASRPDREEWLHRCETENLSTLALERALKLADGQAASPKITKPDVFQCPKCGGWALETDHVCVCPLSRRIYEP